VEAVNVTRSIVLAAPNYRLELSIDATDMQGLADALWDESREAARAAARIEAGIRPYLWDESLDSTAPDAVESGTQTTTKE